MPAAEGKAWASRLVKQPVKVRFNKMEKSTYGVIPLGYIHGSIDKVMPLAAREAMIKLVEEEGATVQQYHIEAGHDMFVSFADVVVSILRRFVEGLGMDQMVGMT